MEFLIKHFNWAPMHYAAAYGHEDVIKTLLSFNAEINYARKKGVLELKFI